jgi:hypothetical protein
MDPPITTETEAGVEISWTYPRDVTEVSDIQVFVEIGGSKVLMDQYCGSNANVLANQSCMIPHNFLNLDMGMDTCDPLYAKVRAYDSTTNCFLQETEWSQVYARVHGCPNKYALAISDVQSTSMLLSWQLYDEAIVSGCTDVVSYEIEIKKGVQNEPWKDRIPKSEVFLDQQYNFLDLEPC